MPELTRQRVSSGGPWEARVGYSRAVRVGSHVFVSGTTAMKDGQLVGTGDVAIQTQQALRTISAALEAAGSTIDDVVRYRVYLIDITDWEKIAPVLSSFFGSVRPANTLVAVAALIHPDMLIEIEADAIIGSAAPVDD